MFLGFRVVIILAGPVTIRGFMRVRHLSLAHFRNYTRLELDLAPHTTILFGDNAQGKSNLLEALYFLATTRSFRASSDRELMSWNIANDPIGFSRIAARAEHARDAFDIEVVLREELRQSDEGRSPTFTKRIKLNDVPRRAIDVIGSVTAVLFSPQDLELVEGAPVSRRRYLDVTISQADRPYCRGLAHYNRVIVQRNHLLRAIRDRGAQADQLQFWDREMVTAGSFVTLQRLSTVQEIGDVAQRIYRELSGREEALTIDYKSSLIRDDFVGPPAAEDVAAAFQTRLNDLRTREVALGMSLVGPHRDDLTFHIDGHDVSAFGSRGQQRTVALALKLAETEFLRERTNEMPILLLDDVLSELDSTRQERVLNSIGPTQQVLLTTTQARTLEGVLPDDTAWIRVERGRVETASPV